MGKGQLAIQSWAEFSGRPPFPILTNEGLCPAQRGRLEIHSLLLLLLMRFCLFKLKIMFSSILEAICAHVESIRRIEKSIKKKRHRVWPPATPSHTEDFCLRACCATLEPGARSEPAASSTGPGASPMVASATWEAWQKEGLGCGTYFPGSLSARSPLLKDTAPLKTLGLIRHVFSTRFW